MTLYTNPSNTSCSWNTCTQIQETHHTTLWPILLLLNNWPLNFWPSNVTYTAVSLVGHGFPRFSSRFYVNLRNEFSGKKKHQKTGILVKIRKVTYLLTLTTCWQFSQKKKKVHVWQHHKYSSENQHIGQKGRIHPLIFDAPLLLDILSYLSEIWSSPSKTLHPLQPLNNFK